MNAKWEKPQTVSTIEIAFGGNLENLMPKMEEIPEEFKRHGGTKWNEVQATWFFSGLPKGTEFYMKDGIDLGVAIRHLSAIQSSFQPKHEHKEAAVAWLMSLWFDDIIIKKE
jgi:hypothetical protein